MLQVNKMMSCDVTLHTLYSGLSHVSSHCSGTTFIRTACSVLVFGAIRIMYYDVLLYCLAIVMYCSLLCIVFVLCCIVWYCV